MTQGSFILSILGSLPIQVRGGNVQKLTENLGYLLQQMNQALFGYVAFEQQVLSDQLRVGQLCFGTCRVRVV